MQREPHYDDVVAEVKEFLQLRLRAADGAGIARERLVVDPGFGFGKTAEHNLTVLARLAEFKELGVPLLAGLSRKSTIGKVTRPPPAERPAGRLALARLAVQRGAT